MDPKSLLGCETERRAIDELLALGETGPRVIALVGEQGSGRTSLVALASAMAVDAGRRVLTVTGLRGEEDIPLSGLSHLLLSFVPLTESLPAAHREALGRPLGLVSDAAPFDLVATGMAVLALMSLRPEEPPLFVAIDDADNVDAETLSVLAFVAKRMDRRRAVLLLTAELLGMPEQFGRNATRLRIGRLNDADAHTLLSRQGLVLDTVLEQCIIGQSAGSPMALLETAAAAVFPGAAARPFREPLRVGQLIEERVMARFRRLPSETQDRLIDAAVTESYGWARSGTAQVAHNDLAVLAPAERSGLIRVDRSGVRFGHPTFWIAIFHATPFTVRIQAHKRVADSFCDQPSRRAWHLGRATLEPDETVASLLEASADDIGRELGRLEKAIAFERASELSPDNDDRARRLVTAAAIAAPTGEIDWVDELAARALACVRDVHVRAKAITTSAWAAAARGRFSQAMADLSVAAAETVNTAPEAAWEVLSVAASVGYQSGSRATQTQMQAATRHLAAAQGRTTVVAAARSLWIESYLTPGTNTGDRLKRLAKLRAEGPTDEATLSRLAGAAWLDDESETAFELADAAYHRLIDQGSHAAAAVIGPIRSWTALDTGRWDDALKFAAHASRVAAAAGGGMLLATDDAVASVVHAVRGDTALAEDRARAALTVIQGEECFSVVARVSQARGLSAAASGNYAEAYAMFSRLFREDGTPLHFHISYFGLGDLAAAALRSGRVEEARTLLGYVLGKLPRDPSVRIRHLVLRARALLAEDDHAAETLFNAAHHDPMGSRWPFERGQLLLDHGAWLRRKRRVGEAKTLLVQSRSIFNDLGAIPWTSRADAELRASHVDVPRPLGALDELTGQQREIVLLAGQGLTNREIATRLYLSPRTVSSHLYRSFPKLGVRDRWQLRDLVEQSVKEPAVVPSNFLPPESVR